MPSHTRLRVVDSVAAYLSKQEIRFIRQLFDCQERLTWKSCDQPLLSNPTQYSIYLLFSYFVECGGSLSDVALTARESDYDRYEERGVTQPFLRRGRAYFWIHQYEANVIDNVALAVDYDSRLDYDSRSIAASIAISRIIFAFESSYTKTLHPSYNALDESTLSLARAYSLCIFGDDQLSHVDQLEIFAND